MEEASHPSPVSMTSNDDGGTQSALSRPSSTSPVVEAAQVKKESSEGLDAMEGVEQAEPLSRKRSNSEQSQGEITSIEVISKKRRVEESAKLRTPSPTPEPLALPKAVTTPLFDDATNKLLQRSCALVLDHVGFDSASKEAMEALCAEVDTYATKTLSYVVESMLAARRSQATPVDFEFAMRHMGLTSSHLKPHLKPPVSPSKTHLIFRATEAQVNLPQTPAALLGKELSGDADKNAKKYIPKDFPAFPSKHTYKSTSVLTDRESDPRKIREKATQAARSAEEALRRLVKVAKTGGHGAKRGLGNNERKKTRNDLWAKSMTGFANEKSLSGENEEQSIAVDAGKQFWRKPIARGRHRAPNTGGPQS